MPRTAEDRFWIKVACASDDDCWTWLAGKSPDGYGKFWFDGRDGYAHRYAYGLLIGPIPAGLEIDHLCRNRACVNPTHLEPVTTKENLHRGETLAARQIALTHCPSDHPYSGDNLRITPEGERICRRCNYLAQIRWRQRNGLSVPAWVDSS